MFIAYVIVTVLAAAATPGQSTVSFTEEDDYCADGSAAAIAACRNRQIGLAIIAEVT